MSLRVRQMAYASMTRSEQSKLMLNSICSARCRAEQTGVAPRRQYVECVRSLLVRIPIQDGDKAIGEHEQKALQPMRLGINDDGEDHKHRKKDDHKAYQLVVHVQWRADNPSGDNRQGYDKHQ